MHAKKFPKGGETTITKNPKKTSKKTPAPYQEAKIAGQKIKKKEKHTPYFWDIFSKKNEQITCQN